MGVDKSNSKCTKKLRVKADDIMKIHQDVSIDKAMKIKKPRPNIINEIKECPMLLWNGDVGGSMKSGNVEAHIANKNVNIAIHG